MAMLGMLHLLYFWMKLKTIAFQNGWTSPTRRKECFMGFSGEGPCVSISAFSALFPDWRD
jgi:hypothetical protein